MRGILALVPVAAAIVACSGIVETADGKIPGKYVAAAQSYAGTYAGQFNNVPGQLILIMDGFELYARFMDQDGNPDLLPQCGSRIGALQSVYGNKSNQIEALEFGFDPGRCVSQAEGRKFKLILDRQSARPAMFAQVVRSEVHCRQSGESGRVCDPPFLSYLDGYFTKTS